MALTVCLFIIFIWVVVVVVVVVSFGRRLERDEPSCGSMGAFLTGFASGTKRWKNPGGGGMVGVEAAVEAMK